MWLPSGRSADSTETIICVHGGGWVSGDKSIDFPHQPLVYFFQGYALCWINYRLATFTDNQFPAQENDVKAAVEYIYNNRSSYHVSDKIILFGIGAGGHLALLHAYKYAPDIKIAAVAAYVPIRFGRII